MTNQRGRSTSKRIQLTKSPSPLGELIRDARIKYGLSLADVAHVCSCSVQFISNIEHGRAPMPWKYAKSVAKLLKIPMLDLQAVCLVGRTDFRAFANLHGKKVQKPEALRHIANSMALATSDPEFLQVMTLYQKASESSRKAFAAEAVKMLG